MVVDTFTLVPEAEGVNLIIIKVIEGLGGHAFRFRFRDPATLEPLTGDEIRVLSTPETTGGGGPMFIRMDPDGDTKLRIADVIFFLASFFFGPLQTLPCPDAADADDDGRHSIADAIFMLSILFLDPARRPDPRLPFPDCGPDPTPDGLNAFSTDNTDENPLVPNRDPALGTCQYICPAEEP